MVLAFITRRLAPAFALVALFAASFFGFSQAVSATGNPDQECSVVVVGNDGGANTSGPYDSTCDGSPSANGNSENTNSNSPCAGCVGNADGKNPPGQLPGPQDNNAGYECDTNQGVGQSNPAHTGCTTTTTAAPVTTTTAAPTTTTIAPTTTTTVVRTTMTLAPTTTTTVSGSVLGTSVTTTTAPAQVLDVVVGQTAVTPTTTAAPASNAPLAHTGANIMPLVWGAFSLFALGLFVLLAGHIARKARTHI